jgi:glycosyltransferase involved in cell wall biosynthesis
MKVCPVNNWRGNSQRIKPSSRLNSMIASLCEIASRTSEYIFRFLKSLFLVITKIIFKILFGLMVLVLGVRTTYALIFSIFSSEKLVTLKNRLKLDGQLNRISTRSDALSFFSSGIWFIFNNLLYRAPVVGRFQHKGHTVIRFLREERQHLEIPSSAESSKKHVTFIVRDIPLDLRAGSYLRLMRISRILTSLGVKVTVLYLNNIEITSKVWGISSKELEIHVTRWRSLEVEIFNFYDYFSSDRSLVLNSNYWLHDLSCAKEFYQFASINFLRGKLILDLVDLEFRRMIQQGRPDSEVEQNLELLKFAIKHSDIIISISEFEKSILESTTDISNKQNYVISNIYELAFSTHERNFNYKYDFLFVGNFLHKPNVEALDYILNELSIVMPERFFGVIGGGLGGSGIDLISRKNVTYLGAPETIEQFYKDSLCVIAPLLTGAGVKGKVLEALYAGKPVIGSAIAWEGIPMPRAPMGWHVETAIGYKDAIHEIENSLQLCLAPSEISALDRHFGLCPATKVLTQIVESLS